MSDPQTTKLPGRPTAANDIASARRWVERVLKKTDRNGYPSVTLYIRGVQFPRLVHRLVAKAFLPNPEGKGEVNHKNGIKYDSRAVNLEWVSRGENQIHGSKVLFNMVGEKALAAKLTWSQVDEIRKRLAAGEKVESLRIAFGVSFTAIYRIRSGRTWRYRPTSI